jgi:hypothetical protein
MGKYECELDVLLLLYPNLGEGVLGMASRPAPEPALGVDVALPRPSLFA